MRLAVSLQVKITGLVLLVLGAAGLAGGAVLVQRLLGAVEQEVGQRAISIARTVAQAHEIQQWVGRPGGAEVIQPAAERIRLATGVEYIVVLDMNRIRYSHPLPERIGTRFEGGDEGPALAQQAYLSRAEGVNGRSIRAFVPVFGLQGPEQVGVVVVGLMEPRLAELFGAIGSELVLAFAFGLGIALIGAWLLARNIKREMFDLEPAEIARLLEERVAVFSSIGEGLVAVDRQERITVINDQAMRMLGVGPEVIGRSVSEVIPHTRLPAVTATGVPELNQVMRLGRVTALVNRLPIRVKGEIAGAVATFRDRTEVQILAEQLTGVQQFADALRAANHEWMNKLHTVAGLIRLRRYQDAMEYIFSATEEQQGRAHFLARRFSDARLAGLLLGKYSRARELGIQLEVDPASRLQVPGPALAEIDLVVILGNLLENAMEAVAALPAGQRHVRCRVGEEEGGVVIAVADTGPGIPPDMQEAIFRPGVSTKGEGRGMGLALVRQEVELAGGRVCLRTEPGRTEFSVWLPLPGAAGGGAAAHAH